MIDWGDALVKEIAARRCIIFLGAGASASCVPTLGDLTKRPPDWKTLLTDLNTRVPAGGDRELASDLINELKFLDAAEVIAHAITKADYADAMRQMLELPRFRQSSIHEHILNLDPKIVITTNFDQIYDRYCTGGAAAAGYNIVKYTDTHLVQQLRSPIRTIVKAHGCISQTDHMVLTRSGYFEARRQYGHFFRVLDALCLTHTILFLGYGLSDPDIQLALENATISATSTNTHYFVAPTGAHPALRNAAARAYNLTYMEYPAGDYADLNASLEELVARVLDYRTSNPDG
ncbi:MAG: SIR2 family protein [Betaproteobacteria bacterium]